MQRARDIVQGARGRSVEGRGGCERGCRQRWNWKFNFKLDNLGKSGVSISDAEICLNVLGDLGVVGEGEEDMLPSAFDENMLFSPLERGHLRTKRCSSTPRCHSYLQFCFSTKSISGFQNYHRWQVVVNMD